jgi:hypothetical protein
MTNRSAGPRLVYCRYVTLFVELLLLVYSDSVVYIMSYEINIASRHKK